MRPSTKPKLPAGIVFNLGKNSRPEPTRGGKRGGIYVLSRGGLVPEPRETLRNGPALAGERGSADGGHRKGIFGKYGLIRRVGFQVRQVLRDGEKVYGALFNQRQEVVFNPANQSIIKSAISALKRNLEYGYEKSYFVHNRWYFAIGLLLTLGVVVALRNS